MFICKFDIPFHILLRYMGEGYYEPSGYDIPYETIIEFAIPVDKIKPEFLRACAFDKNRDITPEQANCYFEKFEEKMNEHAREKTKGE